MKVSPFSATWRTDVAEELNNPDFSDKTITGPVRIDSNGAALVLRDPTSSGNAAQAFIEFRQANGTRTGVVGDVSGSASDIRLVAETGDVIISSTGGNQTVTFTEGRLRFPATQNPSSDPNTLDDYEEGTYSPVYLPATGAFAAVVYDPVTVGAYLKIGNRVAVQGRIRTTSVSVGTAANLVRVSLPFTSIANAACTIWGAGFGANNPSAGQADSSGVALYYRTTANGSLNSLSVADMVAGVGNDVMFSMVYRVSS